jgi:hypothetical protein
MSATTKLTILNNLFIKMFHYAEVGDENPGGGHKHTFDHITLLARGSLRMETDLGEEIHVAPKLFVTKRGVQHKFTALEPDTVMCCVQAIRDGDDVDDIAPEDITTEQAFELMDKYRMATPP